MTNQYEVAAEVLKVMQIHLNGGFTKETAAELIAQDIENYATAKVNEAINNLKIW